MKPLILLKSTTQSDIGYIKVISNPGATIRFDNETVPSGGYHFSNSSVTRRGTLISTYNGIEEYGEEEILMLSPPQFVIVTSVSKKSYTKTTDDRYYVSDPIFASNTFDTPGLYVYNSNTILVELHLNELLTRLRTISTESLIDLDHSSEFYYKLLNDNIMESTSLGPNSLGKLLGWSYKSDISLIAPHLDLNDDDHINSTSMIISANFKSINISEEVLPVEYYGVHNSELIDRFSSYKVIKPQTSGIIVIGSKSSSIDLRSYLPIN